MRLLFSKGQWQLMVHLISLPFNINLSSFSFAYLLLFLTCITVVFRFFLLLLLKTFFFELKRALDQKSNDVINLSLVLASIDHWATQCLTVKFGQNFTCFHFIRTLLPSFLLHFFPMRLIPSIYSLYRITYTSHSEARTLNSNKIICKSEILPEKGL